MKSIETFSPLKVSFGIPSHGWLPVLIAYQDFQLEFEASDVPINPLESLLSGLIILLESKKGEQRTDWHLEPAYYHLTFSRSNEQFKIVIDYDGDKSIMFEGDESFIAAPFANELLKFQSKNYSESHWPSFNNIKTEKLKSLLK